MSENPYSSPLVLETSPEHKTSAAPFTTASNSNLMEIARSTFLAWEKLRFLYIGLLGTLTLLLCGREIVNIEILMLVIAGAFVANVCYFAGPILETYVSWLGLKGKWFRWMLFTVGTLFTMVLAVAFLADNLLPNQN
jgi:hypothetical protein